MRAALYRRSPAGCGRHLERLLPLHACDPMRCGIPYGTVSHAVWYPIRRSGRRACDGVCARRTCVSACVWACGERGLPSACARPCAAAPSDRWERAPPARPAPTSPLRRQRRSRAPSTARARRQRSQRARAFAIRSLAAPSPSPTRRRDAGASDGAAPARMQARRPATEEVALETGAATEPDACSTFALYAHASFEQRSSSSSPTLWSHQRSAGSARGQAGPTRRDAQRWRVLPGAWCLLYAARYIAVPL